jgi:hypothetical protein
MIGSVGPVGIVAWSGVRRRWASLLLLTVVLGLTGAIVLASVAGSHRSRVALDDFLEFHRPGTIEAYVDPSLPVAEQEDLLTAMVEASGRPEDFVELGQVVVAMPGPDGVQGPGTDLAVAQAYLHGEPLTTVQRVLVADGELPLRSGEAAINERLAERRHLEIGDPLPLALFAGEDIDRVGNGDITEPTEVVDVTIGAIVRAPLDLARSPQAQPGTIFEADEASVVLEPSFWQDHARGAAAYGLGASGLVPAEDVDAVTAAMNEAGGNRVLVNPAGSEDLAKIGPVDDAIELEANALLAFAAVVLVFALVVLGSALTRATGDDPIDRQTLGTLGLTRRQLAATTLIRGGGVIALATVIAVIGAVGASPVFPIGLAADAEIDPGLAVDVPVLVFGGLAFAVLAALRIGIGAWSTRRRSAARPTLAGRALPLTPATIGARLVVDGLGRRGTGAARVALATATVGVAAVAAAATFAASLHGLVDHPSRQGWAWDVVVGNYSDPDAVAAGRAALEANPDVAHFTGYNWFILQVDGEDVGLAEVDPDAGAMLPPVLEGRAPTAADEVALGRGTLDDLGKAVGDTVEIEGSDGSFSATVVGAVIAPATISTAMDLDSGGIITFEAARRGFGDVEGALNPVGYLVTFAPGTDAAAARARLHDDFPGTVVGPMQPLDVSNLERVRSVPYLLAALLGTLALVSVVVSLASAARRRRREVAVLRAMGLARNQLRRLMASEASVFVGLAAVVGVVLGVVLGRVAWRAAADGLGSEVGPVVPGLAILGATLVVLLIVNLYGQGLAVVVGRRKPGADLRTE